MRKTGLKRFVPIIARDPTKKNAGNREISTAFLGKLPVGNSPYSNIKTAETPAVGKIAGKNQEQPKISQKKQPPRFAAQNCAVKRGGCLCPLAGCNLWFWFIRRSRLCFVLRPLAGCDVMRLATFSKFKWNFQRPLAGCNPSTKPCSPKLFGSILRPLAGCDCPLWRAFMLERRAISYVPLRGVIDVLCRSY